MSRFVVFLVILIGLVSVVLSDRRTRPDNEVHVASASIAAEDDLIMPHLRGKTPGADDIWDDGTRPELRCTTNTGGTSGCSEAPACDNVGECTRKEMTCESFKWTGCRGCWLGAPACPSGYSCQYVENQPGGFAHRGGGEFCSAACCYRVGKKTMRRSCPKTGDCGADGDGDAGAIVGIVVGVLVGIGVIVGVILCARKKQTPVAVAPVPAAVTVAPMQVAQAGYAVPANAAQPMQVAQAGYAVPANAAQPGYAVSANTYIAPVPAPAPSGNAAANQFCPHCGASQPASNFCDKCGKPMN